MTVRLAGGGEVRAHTITFKLSRTLGWERLWGWFGVLWSRAEEEAGELGPPRLQRQLHEAHTCGRHDVLTAAHHFFLDEQSCTQSIYSMLLTSIFGKSKSSGTPCT